MSPGIAGLPFLPIGIGSLICAGIFLAYDRYLANARKRGAAWALNEDYRRLPLACVGGPLWAVSLFWIGWSAYPNVHWIAPTLSGLTLGIGFILIFMVRLHTRGNNSSANRHALGNVELFIRRLPGMWMANP